MIKQYGPTVVFPQAPEIMIRAMVDSVGNPVIGITQGKNLICTRLTMAAALQFLKANGKASYIDATLKADSFKG